MTQEAALIEQQCKAFPALVFKPHIAQSPPERDAMLA